MKLSIVSLHEHVDHDNVCFYADSKVYYTMRSPNRWFEAEFQALPFRHYLNPEKDIMEILIQPDKVKDPELLKDLLKEGD